MDIEPGMGHGLERIDAGRLAGCHAVKDFSIKVHSPGLDCEGLVPVADQVIGPETDGAVGGVLHETVSFPFCANRNLIFPAGKLIQAECRP